MANKLKEMRFKKMLSMSELARLSGVSRMTIWKIETGRTDDIKASTMSALAKALDMPITKIFFAK